MTADDVPMSEEMLVLEKPINIRSVSKPQFLFYLAGQTPLSIDELADDCSSRSIRSGLIRRFETELRIDRADHIRLTGEARKPIIKASKPTLKTAQRLFSRADDVLDDGEYSKAVDRLSKSVTLLETVQEKLNAVDHESTTVEKYLTAARKKHDYAAKEATKDSINYHILKARDHESRGDEQRDDNPSAAISEYQKAREALESAIKAAREYNDSRVSGASAALSVDPLSNRLETLSTKMPTVDGQVEENNSGTSPSNIRSVVTDATNSADDDADDAETNKTVSLQDIQPEISGFGRASRLSLEHEGYESLSDIVGSSKRELATVDRIGTKTAEKLISYAETEQAQKSPTDNQTHSTTTKRTADNTSKDDTHVAAVSDRTESAEDSDKASSRNSQLDSTAFKNSWKTITKGRIDGQFLAKVTEIKTPRGDRKSETLVIADREGKEIEFDVWKTHGIDIDWSVGKWYALMEATGNCWEDDTGHTKKRLSTTSDFEILCLGSDFEPITPRQAGPSDTASDESRSSTETRVTSGASSDDDNRREAGRHSKESTQQQESVEESDNDGIFEDIMSDFDDLE